MHELGRRGVLLSHCIESKHSLKLTGKARLFLNQNWTLEPKEKCHCLKSSINMKCNMSCWWHFSSIACLCATHLLSDCFLIIFALFSYFHVKSFRWLNIFGLFRGINTWSVCVSVCLSACLSVCMYVHSCLRKWLGCFWLHFQKNIS